MHSLRSNELNLEDMRFALPPIQILVNLSAHHVEKTVNYVTKHLDDNN
jgi:hypothetical protein